MVGFNWLREHYQEILVVIYDNREAMEKPWRSQGEAMEKPGRSHGEAREKLVYYL